MFSNGYIVEIFGQYSGNMNDTTIINSCSDQNHCF